MKIKSLLLITCFIAVGVYAGSIILNTTQKSSQISKHESNEPEQANSIPRGPNGGWLFTEKDLQVEVKIFETGIPPSLELS